MTERSAALRAQALAWQPFLDAELRLATMGEHGLAFAWDRGAVQQALLQAGMDAATLKLWPAVLMREAMVDGLRLIEGDEGYEAEYWAAGCLLVSRWWPVAPNPSEWHAFVRSLGAAGTEDWAGRHEMPQAQRLSTHAHPWIDVRPLTDLDGTVSSGEVLGWRAVLLCCIAVTAASAHQLLASQTRVDGQKGELAGLQAASGTIVSARDRALELSAETRQLTAVIGGVQPLELMQHLVQILPKDVLVREFDFNAGRLRLGLDTPPTLARSALIKQLQDGGWLRDLREMKSNSTSGNTVLEMRVEGTRAPLLSASAAVQVPDLKPDGRTPLR